MNKKNKFHYFIIAGEDSGDLHGSHILRELKNINSNITFSGLGGRNMAIEGLMSFEPIENLSVMGFIEVLKRVFFFIKLKKRILKYIKESPPDKIILIDYPGFNLRLAQAIKKQCNIPIIYYISPQIWAWKENRLNIIKKYIDHMIVIFPFEKDWYHKRHLQVQYFGHPIIDLNQKTQHQKKSDTPFCTIGLCPGSRLQEIQSHLPILKEVIDYNDFKQEVKFVIYKAPGIDKQIFQPLLEEGRVSVSSDSILSSFHNIDYAIVASGTATLECAVSNTPMVVIYKMSWLSWIITKLLIKSKFASIVNILSSEKQVVPELLQNNCNPNNIILCIEKFIKNGDSIHSSLKKIRASLGGGFSYQKTASFIYNV